jgi:hypothetical protein
MRERELPRVGVACFRADGDRARYARFARVRLDVFSRELGWPLLEVADPATGLFDPYDAGADLWLAETPAGEPVGIVRARRVIDAFPHRELFETHLAATGLDRDLAIVGTINALAVVPAYRRVACAGPHPATASEHLLRAGLEGLLASGVRVVLATVLSAASAHAFGRVGFRILDAPEIVASGFRLANVGIVLQPDTSPALASIDAYFSRCERVTLSAGPIEHVLAG